MACKPGSVASLSELRPLMVIHLDQRLPSGSRALPPQPPENRRCRHRSDGVLRNLGLLRVGFTLPLPLLVARCALTAPFHPYPCRNTGGLLSVALSLSSRSPGVTRHPVSVEPGLSSPIRRPARPSSPLLGLVLNQGWGGVKLF
jgi:hypothetical protein